MNYTQVMRWHKKHPKGGKPQYMGFSAGSGFWPSMTFLENLYDPYLEACGVIGVTPLKAEPFYRLTLRNHIMCDMDATDRAEYTRLMRIGAQQEPNNRELDVFRA